MSLASQGVVLGTAASAECHKYFPLFRNGSGLVAGEERGRRGWMDVGGEGVREVDEKSKINDWLDYFYLRMNTSLEYPKCFLYFIYLPVD